MVAIARPIANEKRQFNGFQQLAFIDFMRFQIQQRRDEQHHEQFRMSVTFGKNGNCDASAPNAICTSGVETLGMKRLRNEDSTTAAIIHTINSNTANVPPLRVFFNLFQPTKRYLWACFVFRFTRRRNRIVAGMQWSDDMELAIALARRGRRGRRGTGRCRRA